MFMVNIGEVGIQAEKYQPCGVTHGGHRAIWHPPVRSSGFQYTHPPDWMRLWAVGAAVMVHASTQDRPLNTLRLLVTVLASKAWGDMRPVRSPLVPRSRAAKLNRWCSTFLEVGFFFGGVFIVVALLKKELEDVPLKHVGQLGRPIFRLRIVL